ncbi:ligninase LG6 precursor [Lojkania enalia]|uniref:Peroxidase n=1 Tax=Lojkania enalia TaxID=147567 RepID=A0A9P4K391_9PLEO|nr:ligninase LG6 precursor [Didymosphaeria enalia]
MLYRISFFLGLCALAAAQCPAVWSTIASDLQSEFSGCNDNARAAIRAPVHDCVNNGCDGSLILAGECTRVENAGLETICNLLGSKSTQYSVGAADMIQFAQAVALSVCPLSPRVRALVGRQDSSSPATEGKLARSNDTVDTILSIFGAVGLDTTDVVALVGAHSTAIQRFDDPSRAGESLDSTPGTWDTTFYAQALTNTAPYTLQSDQRLSTDLRTAVIWLDFSVNAPGWNTAFISAMEKLQVVGNDVNSLTDCTSVLPGAAKIRREAKRAPIGERAFANKIVS